jgi:arylsulfatase A-like enzyme
MAGIRSDPGMPSDGRSLTPLLKQEQAPWGRDTLYWHFPHLGDANLRPHGAIRHREYKLIEYFEDGRLELYNLAEDLGETRNLVAKMPDRAREMVLMLRRWRETVGAKCLKPNPDYKPLTQLPRFPKRMMEE